MDKKSFFLKAIQMPTKPYALKEWLLSIFTVIQEGPEDYLKDVYPYRVVQTTTGVYFVDPTNGSELTKIEDAAVGQALFRPLSAIDLPGGILANCPENITGTTVGNVLFNLVGLSYPFGNKIPYIAGDVDIGQIESIIAMRLRGIPGKDETRDDKFIYVDEYMKFSNALAYLTELNEAVTQAMTAKAITAPDGIVKFKKELFEKYKDSLNDPTTVARIEKELIAFDAAYLKGDPSSKFLISGKSRNVVRKRLFLMYGGETGLSSNMTLIGNSLTEGWTADKFPVMNNTARAGSFDRGSETQKGGEEVKWLLRASSNIRVLEEDCGTKLGKGYRVRKSNYKKIINLYVMTNNGIKLIEDEATAETLIGKNILVRSPMFCKNKLTDYCRHCVGERLGSNKNAVSSAITAEGSAFMLLSLKAAHGKSVSLAKMNLEEAFT